MIAETQKTVIRHGYEYTLVLRLDRRGAADPCALGFQGYALKSCKKVQPKDGTGEDPQPDQVRTGKDKSKKK